jgi:hypothetical protein
MAKDFRGQITREDIEEAIAAFDRGRVPRVRPLDFLRLACRREAIPAKSSSRPCCTPSAWPRVVPRIAPVTAMA